jgi:uncharacterized protein
MTLAEMLPDFSTLDIIFTAILFVWTGFVRSGLGFGGGALGLPLMLFVYDQPIFWLPVIGLHLLFFSALTLRTRLNNVDWPYLRQSLVYIIPAALVGVFGLLNLPNRWLVLFIYSITLFYAVIWLFNINIRSNKNWIDKILLIIGGYVAGTSLTGAPLMVAVFMRHIAMAQLRNTLFVLWFVLVTIKMATFAAVGVDLHITTALLLLPVAAIGHVMGIYAHDKIMQNDLLFRRIIGGFLIVVCLPGMWQAY